MSNTNPATETTVNEQIVGSISGGKTHLLHHIVRVTTEEGVKRIRGSFNMETREYNYREVPIPVGTEYHYHYPACGQVRSAGTWKVYQNHIRTGAEEITCVKCQAKALKIGFGA